MKNLKKDFRLSAVRETGISVLKAVIILGILFFVASHVFSIGTVFILTVSCFILLNAFAIGILKALLISIGEYSKNHKDTDKIYKFIFNKVAIISIVSQFSLASLFLIPGLAYTNGFLLFMAAVFIFIGIGLTSVPKDSPIPGVNEIRDEAIQYLGKLTVEYAKGYSNITESTTNVEAMKKAKDEKEKAKELQKELDKEFEKLRKHK